MKKNIDYWQFAEVRAALQRHSSRYSQHGSGWMLVAFAAIALLLKTDQGVTWLVSPAVLVGVVSFLATLGLLVLWINDQLVYQRLLDCAFIIALRGHWGHVSTFNI